MSIELSPSPTDNLLTLGLRFRLIDVREDHECSEYPIVSDYHIPFSRFNAAELRTARDAKLLVVCEDGERSLAATQMLHKQGWNNAVSLRGGLENFLSARNNTTVQAA